MSFDENIQKFQTIGIVIIIKVFEGEEIAMLSFWITIPIFNFTSAMIGDDNS
ncbi:MAG: hypothetical protein ACR2LR_28085 [Hassallia sp.]